MADDVMLQASKYYQLVQQGVPPAQAFQQAFPNGLPNSAANREKAAKKAAANQQKGALAQTGGVLAGALGSKVVYDAVTGEPILGGIFEGSKGAAQAGTQAASQAGTTAATNAGAATGEAAASAAAAKAVESGAVTSIAAGEAVPAGYTAVGTAADGGTLVASDAAIQSGTESGLSVGDVGTYLAWAYGAYKTGKLLTGDASEEDKVQGVGDRARLAVADAYTMGLATPAFEWANSQWGGTMQKMRDARAKFDPVERFLIGALDTDAYKQEGDRLSKLQDNGVNVPEELGLAMALKRGRSSDELKKFEQKKIDAGQHGNVKFAESRLESDLTPEDIWGNAAFLEKYGNDWLQNMNEDQRRAISALALQSGAVNEHHGTVDVDWSKQGLEQGVSGVLGKDWKPSAPQAQQPLAQALQGPIQKPMGAPPPPQQMGAMGMTPQMPGSRLPMNQDPTQAGFGTAPMQLQPKQQPLTPEEQARLNAIMQGAQGRRLSPQEQWRANQIRGYA